jgi:hypothetical protein
MRERDRERERSGRNIEEGLEREVKIKRERAG